MKKIFIYFTISFIFSQSLFAQNDVAVLAENCFYIGAKSYLKPGIYQTSQLGIRNNQLSAIHLPEGMALEIFENDRNFGRSQIFYSSVLCMPSVWNNKASSVKIYWVNETGNESGNNLPPQGDKVIFYKDNQYSGMSRAMGEGSFSSTLLGFLTDNVSSIYIPNGQEVQTTDKQGRTQIFRNSVSNLAQYNWDNKISAGLIRNNFGGGDIGTLPPKGDQVILYSDMKYSGSSKAFGQGSFGTNFLGNLTNNISSIYVPAGQSIKVYDRQNQVRTFTTSVTSLSQYGWDNRVSSGFITKTNSSIPPQGSEVIFYRDNQYSGVAMVAGEGIFSSRSLGFLSNNISSVYIPFGKSVMVYDQRNQVQTFTTSVSNLSQYGWDNKIYSGNISSGSQDGNGGGSSGGNGGGSGGNNGGGNGGGFGGGSGGNNGGGNGGGSSGGNGGGFQGGNAGGNQGGNSRTVNLYVSTNYMGAITPCGEGSINNIGINAENKINSIQIPPGFMVTVYDRPNLTGNSRTFNNSVANLSVYGWNNRISSLYILRR